MSKNLLWYAAYGSNLLEERFTYYICGGFSNLNNRSYPGCKDQTKPIRDRAYSIKYPIYFGNISGSWEGGGVAFLDTDSTQDYQTLGRIYLITQEQFDDIQQQEGPSPKWYGKRVYLGELEGYPIWTITCEGKNASNMPSNKYLDVIKSGIEETYPELGVDQINIYLEEAIAR